MAAAAAFMGGTTHIAMATMNDTTRAVNSADSTREGFMSPTVAPRRRAQQTERRQVPQGLSGELRVTASRFYADLTDGLTNRLPLRNAENLRRGVVRSAPVAVAELLEAGRRCGLSREWALRLAVWVRAQVDALYPTDSTPLPVRRQRAMELEGAGNLRELASVAADRSDVLTPEAADALLAEARVLEAEIASEQDRLACMYARLNRRGA